MGIATFDTINPILSNNKNVQDVSKLIFEPLVNITTDYKTEPCLATEWAKIDATTYLIKLREGVQWSNGEKFTAKDVQYTIDRLKETQSIYAYNVQYVIRVVVVDDYTIQIVLSQEIPFFEYNLAFPIMSSSFYAEDDFQNTEKNISPIGTGMYKITDVQSDKIILGQNDQWWNKENKNILLQNIKLNLYSTPGELYNAFKLGNIDLLNTTNLNYENYIGTLGYNLKEFNGREHIFLAFNMQNAILSNLEVRKAISYCIDKQNIVSNVFQNKYTTSDFPLNFGSWLYTQSHIQYGYNIEQVANTLINDGWSFSYKYWQKYVNYRTQRLNFNLIVKASDNNKVAIAETIKSQLEQQGIRINLIKANDNQYNSYIANKNYDIILCGAYVSANPSLNTYLGNNNIANYYNEEVNIIMQEVNNITDENLLKEKFDRLIQIYNADVPYISICNSKEFVACNSGLAGEITPNWFNIFYNIESWYK